jgi:hypothetical protein
MANIITVPKLSVHRIKYFLQTYRIGSNFTGCRHQFPSSTLILARFIHHFTTRPTMSYEVNVEENHLQHGEAILDPEMGVIVPFAFKHRDTAIFPPVRVPFLVLF